MSHLSKIFTKTKVDIPNKSAFDMSHENIGTLTCGTLVPVLTEELLPGDTISIGEVTQVTLPPMATDFYGRVDFRMEAFFVPYRILWGGWQNFITNPVNTPFTDASANNYSRVLPTCRFLSSSNTVVDTSYIKAGSLVDYLGYKAYNTAGVITNILPLIAYYKIYDDWYRNSLIQTPLFSPLTTESSSTDLWTLPNVIISPNFYLGESTFYDGTVLGELMQRNWAKDYFTTAHLYPQAAQDGSGASVDTSSDSLTISQIRAANVLQRWLERNNIAGTRYSDQIKATYGITPSDALMDRPMLIGSSRFGVYNKSVFQNVGTDTSNSQNPFSTSAGSSSAASKGFGKDSLCSKFTASEHGIVMVLASLVPHANYSTGTRRYLNRCCPSDFANPLLQGLGEQAIKTWELLYSNPLSSTSSAFAQEPSSDSIAGKDKELLSDVSTYSGSYYSVIQSDDNIFGYTQQYAEYKYHDDEVHGLLRLNENLESFVLQRYLTSAELSTDFIRISTDAMDNVTAVSAALSNYGAWYDIGWQIKKISTLSEYVIPTLGDLKNTHKENIPYNGTML